MSNETLGQFAEQFQYCAVCWSPEGLHIHHIVGGAGRRHERYNLVRLCHTCHHKVHSVSGREGLSHGAVLNAKRLCDDSFYSPRSLAALRHRQALPYSLEPLPDWAKDIRKGYDPFIGEELMPINSRRKGKARELELVHKLKDILPASGARRAQQYSGTESASDVIATGLSGLWIECKGVQNLNLHKTMDTSVEQCGELVPVVCHRKNGTGWLVSVRIEDLIEFAEEVVQCRKRSA